MQAPRPECSGGAFLFGGGEPIPFGASTAFSSVILSLSKGDIGMRWSSASLRQAQTDKLDGGGVILKAACRRVTLIATS